MLQRQHWSSVRLIFLLLQVLLLWPLLLVQAAAQVLVLVVELLLQVLLLLPLLFLRLLRR